MPRAPVGYRVLLLASHTEAGPANWQTQGRRILGALLTDVAENPEAWPLAAPTELSNFQGVNGEKIACGRVSNKRLNSASVPHGQDLGLVHTLLSTLSSTRSFRTQLSPSCTGANKY